MIKCHPFEIVGYIFLICFTFLGVAIIFFCTIYLSLNSTKACLEVYNNIKMIEKNI